MSYCGHCKTNDGPHFIPPSLGDPGFYMCMTPEQITAVFEKHDHDVVANYHPDSPRAKMAAARLARRKVENP